MERDDFEDYKSDENNATSLSSEIGAEDLPRLGREDPDFVR